MDELWRMLRASSQMVYFIDTIIRLNRGRGLGQLADQQDALNTGQVTGAA